MTPNLRTCLLALVVTASAVSPPSPALAHAATPKVDPRAGALLDEVVKAYKALPAYADRGEFGLRVKEDGHERTQSMPRILTFARPNKISLSSGGDEVLLVSDGKTLTTKFLEKYLEAPAPATLSLKAIEASKPARMFLDAPPSLPTRILLALLTADDPARVILRRAEGLSVEDDRKADGKTSRVLLVDRKGGTDLRLVIDADTKLLTRIEYVLGEAQRKNEPDLVPDSIAWVAGKVTTTTPEASAFEFAPGKGVEKVATLADLEKGLGSNELADHWVGRSAPDFTLTVLGGPGKTTKVSKADLAGKVVLIDFWATWCGPCMKELPEIADLVDSYDKKDAKVAVVALSVDEAEGADGPRKLVEKTLAAEGLALDRGKVGRIALDPEGEIAKAFTVNGFPTLVLLDAKGVIRAVHVGFDPGIREILGDEIDGLLDGKAKAND